MNSMGFAPAVRSFLISLVLTVIALGCLGTGRAFAANPDATSEAPSATLRLLTYNVLAESSPVAERITALTDILGQSQADIIALQEVTPDFLAQMAKAPWFAAYHISQAEGKPVPPRGLCILSRIPIEDCTYRFLPDQLTRGVLIVHIRAHERRIAVGTIHLASPLKADALRADELDFVWPLLADADDAVLMGDFNFGDGRTVETEHLDKRYADLWVGLHPGEAGYTWDMEKSAMARRGAFPGERSRRLDRILVRSNVWRAKMITIVGNRPVSEKTPDLFPSDHFGLLGQIEMPR